MLALLTEEYKLTKVKIKETKEASKADVFVEPIYGARKPLKPGAFVGTPKRPGIFPRLIKVGLHC